MKTSLLLLLGFVALATAAEKADGPRIIYRSDFASGDMAHWVNPRFGLTPKKQPYLGMYGRQSTALLHLAELPPHQLLRVRCTLFLIGSVDGNSKQDGPDFWGLSAGSTELLRTTFNFYHLENQDKHPQAFPDDYPTDHPAGTGASALGTLGFRFDLVDLGALSAKADMTYKIEVAFPHSDSDVELRFWSEFNDRLEDEAWGLEKVEVEAVPEFTEFTDAEMKKLWAGLSGADAMQAFDATWRLAEGGPRTVEFIRGQLGDGGGKERIVKLIADYGSADVVVREKAHAAIEKLGPSDLLLLRAALAEAGIPKRVRDDLGELAADVRAESPLFLPRVTRLLRVLHTPEADRLAAQISGAAEEAGGKIAKLLWRGTHAVASDKWPFAVLFTPDGRQVVSGGGDGARLWDTDTGRCVRYFPAFFGRHLALSADGQTLALGDRSSRIFLWELSSGALRRSLRVRRGEVMALLFLPHTNQLVSGADEGLRFWDLTDFSPGDPVPLLQPMRTLTLSPDGKTIATSETAWNPPHGVVTLRDASTGEVRRKIADGNVTFTRADFSPDGSLLAVTPHKGKVRVYDLATGQENMEFEGTSPFSEGAVFSPDGKYLCTFGGSFDGRTPATQCGLRLYRLADGAEVWRSTVMEECQRAAFSPDGTRLFAADTERNVWLWKIDLAAAGAARP